MKNLNPSEYAVAWIATQPVEAETAQYMLDERHDGFPAAQDDGAMYIAGAMAGHNIIIATLPRGQQYEAGASAALVGHLKKFFPNLWFGLLVGVAIGLPNLSRDTMRDIRIGDVLVGFPDGESAGLVSYDLGKETDDGFQSLRLGHALTTIDAIVRCAIGATKIEASHDTEKVIHYCERFRGSIFSDAQFHGTAFRSLKRFPWLRDDGSTRNVIRGCRPGSERIRVWHGTIGSGAKVWRDLQEVNEVRDKYGLIGLEMEATGIMDQIPIGVIRGVCGYGDGLQYRRGKPFAAATAAAYARALLDKIPPRVSPNSAVVQAQLRADNIFSQTGVPRYDLEADICRFDLFITDPLDHKKILNLRNGDRVAGTCEWILGTEDLTAWLGSDHDQNSVSHANQILWLHGDPGTGKSTLAVYLTDVLSHRFSATEGHTLVYFFCDSAFDTRRTATSVVRGLLWQLVEQHPQLLDYVLPKYNEWGTRLFGSFDALWAVFIAAAADRNTGRKYCIIDALDECDNESQKALLQQLRRTFQSDDSPPNIRILVTSRSCPDIRKQLEKFAHKDLASFPDVAHDIDQCIKKRVASLRYTEEIKAQVTELLRQKAQGTFLWVCMACKALKRTPWKDAVYFLEAMFSDDHFIRKEYDKNREIEEKIRRWLPALDHRHHKIRQAYFDIDWDPRSFVQVQQYDANPHEAICSAITLTGLAEDAQALTSSQYLSQTWPSTGNFMMQMIQEVLRGESGKRYSTILPDLTELTAWSCVSRFKVKALGSEDAITGVGAQLAWLGAALRSSPEGKGVCYCTPFVTVAAAADDRNRKDIMTTRSRFEIYFRFKEVESELSNGHCWHNMFRRPVVVCRYPISQRTATQTGLEIPLNMMARMVDTEHVVPFDSTWYLKGFSSMLVLVDRRDDLFLWHHVYDSKGGRVSYFDHKNKSDMTVTATELKNARHAVGWCADVEILAGKFQTKADRATHNLIFNKGASEGVNYNVGASGLPRPNATWLLDKISISAGKFISGGISISAADRDRPLHVSRDTYRDKMRWVSGQYAILWDVKDERGWLINGADCLLHMVQASLENDLKWMQDNALHSDILFQRREMKRLTTSRMPGSALSVLTNAKNKKMEIFVSEVDEWDAGEKPNTKDGKATSTHTCFKDLVEKQHILLEQSIEHQRQIGSQPGLNLNRVSRGRLEGWDFRDLAVTVKTHPIYLRRKSFPPTGHGWVNLAREIKAITIFGDDFGEIIRPTEAASKCKRWALVPTGRQYMAVCVSDLKAILKLKDHEHRCKTPIRICQSLSWHAPNNLFRQCQCGNMTGQQVKHSDLAQVLAPRQRLFARVLKSSGTVELDNAGAVILGYSSSFGLHWPNQGDSGEGDISTDTLEEAGDFLNNAMGTSPVPTTTEGQTEGQAITAPDCTMTVPPAGLGTSDAASSVLSAGQGSTRQSYKSLQLHQHSTGNTSDEATDNRSDHMVRAFFSDETDDRISRPASGNVTTEPLECPTILPSSRWERSTVGVASNREDAAKGSATRRKGRERLKSFMSKLGSVWRSRR
ncbi:hypothetical protein LLEC1_03282 [Akanthomyces lecanii]|uniref:NACHT domain-containing protein n=1 Tax=Cordyceps confragosa TaxID=2714763 RepID=A0A179IG62_CORDF|nr:hypothetical protein LLEC1_03282 [Akanthomyces lecanii]